MADSSAFMGVRCLLRKLAIMFVESKYWTGWLLFSQTLKCHILNMRQNWRLNKTLTSRSNIFQNFTSAQAKIKSFISYYYCITILLH